MSQVHGKPQILCVDRDSLSQRLRREILQSAGYATVAVNSMTEAEPYLQDANVALAVVDEAAVQSAELSQTLTAYPSVPVVVLLGTPALPASSSRVQYFSKLDGPEAFLRTVREYVKSD